MSVLSRSTVAQAEGQEIPALCFRAVTKVHQTAPAARAVLRDVTLEVRAGEMTVLVGPSGSGKSTLLNLAGGLDSATEGEVTLLGHSLTHASVKTRTEIRRQAVGYVFQDYNLIRTLTALENVALPLELEGQRGRQSSVAARAALERVGVGALAAQYPDAMSGGEQQRVAIARAVAAQRRIVLADEPTGALDSSNGAAIVQLLLELAQAGAACIVATHNPEVAARADRLIQLRDGRVVGDSCDAA